jgi:tripartite ATP-independent transporter DctM subunit
MSFLIGTLFLVLFIVLGIPVGYALGIAGVASMLMLVPTSAILALMTNLVHEGTGNYVIMTIPMFVLMAEFLSAGGVTQDLMMSCNHLLRRVKGGMAMACVLSGAVLAAASGSSTASAASITRAAYPPMMKAGYSSSFAVGLIAMSGTLAIMIPPSVAFVLFGLMTDTSIGKLFIAGIVPGLITALGYAATITIVLRLKPGLGPKPEREAELAAVRAKAKVWPITTLVVVVFGSLYSGIATPTEIAAIGALAALLIAYFTGRMSRVHFRTAIGNTLRTTAMIVTIIFSAQLFGYFISLSKASSVMLTWIAQSGLSPTAVMLLVVGVYLVLGMLMDQGAIIILTAPISTALIVGLGFNPVWWGVIIIKTAEIGMVTPPMGLNIFVAAAAARADLRASFIGVMPFVATELILLALLLAFPQISLYLTF